MEIGKPQETIIVEPLEDPFAPAEPAHEPEPVEAPVEVPA
jgi:hypothetical protein